MTLLDPLVPRPLDLPTPIDGELDRAKIVAAPSDPAEWPAWRERLAAWRARAREGYDGSAYERNTWTQSCFACALVWLWDELLWDGERFTPDRLLADAESFGGWDALVLWHAYPVIGIDERNQFDFYRDVPGIRELVADLQARGLKVFVDYNPWDVGTRREPVSDAEAVAQIVEWLGADGVFLDTMKEAMPELRAALPDTAFEGESTLPTERIRDHHLSWAQWFADSEVPGVIRAKWFEQRHMLHHTRRWNRSHLEELHSAWLNGVGMLIWENVFGSWVGWNARDKELLRAMLPVQRRYAKLLAHGEWTPLADCDDGFASTWTDGATTLTAVVRGDGGIEAHVNGERIMAAGGGDATFPYRDTVRVAAPVVRGGHADFVPVEPRRLTAVFRRRETGTYGDAPYVEEWKPLPPRLHDVVAVERPAPAGRCAISTELGPAGLTLAQARAWAAERGARLPTEDEWQLAAEAGAIEPAGVWEWTESEHTDGRTRFVILKGGSDYRAEGSDWYVDGGRQAPAYSLKYLLAGPLQASPNIAFRLAVDL
jgi:hypothetical protein